MILRGERWGWLHVLHGGDPIVGTAAYAIDRAADGIAIALLGARESGARSAQRQNALISRLLLGDISGDAFVNRALRIGRDLRDRALLVVSVCREGATNTGEDAMEELCRTLKVPAVVADLGEHTLVIMGLSRTRSEKQVVERLTELDVRAGISRPVSASQLPAAVEQARSAASVALARPDKAVHRFDDLGVLRLLASLAGGPELARSSRTNWVLCSNTTPRPPIRSCRPCVRICPVTETSRKPPKHCSCNGERCTTDSSASRPCSGAHWTTRTTARRWCSRCAGMTCCNARSATDVRADGFSVCALWRRGVLAMGLSARRSSP